MSQVPDLTRRCETLGTVESRLVLVLVTDGAEYFKDHPEYAGGAYSFPLIGVIALDSVPEVMPGSHEKRKILSSCIESPTVST
jgi:hypothetical protein